MITFVVSQPFVCAKDSCIKLVQIQNKYAEKTKTNKISSSEWRKVSSSVPLAVARPNKVR